MTCICIIGSSFIPTTQKIDPFTFSFKVQLISISTKATNVSLFLSFLLLSIAFPVPLCCDWFKFLLETTEVKLWQGAGGNLASVCNNKTTTKKAATKSTSGQRGGATERVREGAIKFRSTAATPAGRAPGQSLSEDQVM